MPKYFLGYADKPMGDGFAGRGSMRIGDIPGLRWIGPMTKVSALDEARRLLASGEGFDPLLYAEGTDDFPVMNTEDIRRQLGLSG
jgi:hypothetical protein